MDFPFSSVRCSQENRWLHCFQVIDGSFIEASLVVDSRYAEYVLIYQFSFWFETILTVTSFPINYLMWFRFFKHSLLALLACFIDRLCRPHRISLPKMYCIACAV